MNRISDLAADARNQAGAPIEPMDLADFTATRRMVYLALIAIALGVIATYVAFAPLQLIGILPFEYLLPPWLRPGRPVVRNHPT